MKYTIHGFSQIEALSLGLDNDDLLLLRWFSDFSHSKKMKSELIKGITYYWINYQTVCEELPIIAMNKRNMARRFMNLSDKKVLIHKTIKINGTFSYYGFGDAFESLISDNSDRGYTKNGIGGIPEMVQGVYQKRHTKDSSIINSSIIKSHTEKGNKSKKSSLCVELASQVEIVVGQKTTQEVIKSLLKKSDEETIKNYISTWDKYKDFAQDENNPLAWFIHCVSSKRPVPQIKENKSYNKGQETFRNFDQREYTEEDFEGYYANLNNDDN